MHPQLTTPCVRVTLGLTAALAAANHRHTFISVADGHMIAWTTAAAVSSAAQAFNSGNNTYTVLYDDGEVAEENLSKSKWRIEGTAAKATPKAAGAAAGASKTPKAAAAGAPKPTPPAHGPRGAASAGAGAAGGAHPQALVGQSIKIWQADVHDWVAGDVTVSTAAHTGWRPPRPAASADTSFCKLLCAGLVVTGAAGHLQSLSARFALLTGHCIRPPCMAQMYGVCGFVVFGAAVLQPSDA